MFPPTDDDAVEAALTNLVRQHDKHWCSLDSIGLADLWERDSPQPMYLGDEYAAPLIGDDALDRHWARVGSRLNTVARAVLLSRWRLTGTDSDSERSGASWITWLLVRRGLRYRIFHHMESQIYLG